LFTYLCVSPPFLIFGQKCGVLCERVEEEIKEKEERKEKEKGRY
jgi:hypothetical protein